MNNVTPNKNYLSPISFGLTIDHSKFANLEYFCNKVSLPSIDAPAVKLQRRGQAAYFAGDTVTYPDLSVSFIVTENMDNYLELFNWIKNNREREAVLTADIILSVLSSHNNVTRQLRFVNAIPVALGGLEFDATGNVEYLTTNATFSYSYIDIIR